MIFYFDEIMQLRNENGSESDDESDVDSVLVFSTKVTKAMKPVKKEKGTNEDG